MQSIKDILEKELAGVALVRIDLNTDDVWRLESALPTLSHLQKNAKAVVILSHKGRPSNTVSEGAPSGDDVESLSLKPNAEVIGNALEVNVEFFSKFDWDHMREEISASEKGSVFMLENVRFLEGELENSKELAEKFASLGDYFVNEAFAVSHRANASVVALAEALPAYAGLGLEKEIAELSSVIEDAERPLVFVLGGAKASDKLGIMNFFKDRADAFLVGGAAANTLLSIKGVDVGSSLIDKKALKDPALQDVLLYPGLVLPKDWKEKDGAILDIGDEAIEEYKEIIHSAKTIVWSGPLGLTEDMDFRKGSQKIAEAISQNDNAYSLAGGGETVSFLREEGLQDSFSFISTGGGAMLEFLAGKDLPGLQILDK